MVSYQYMSYYCGMVYCIDKKIKENTGWLFFTVLHFVKTFVWYRSVFTQYSYYRDFFCLGTALRLHDCHPHGWVHYIDTAIITVLRFVWYCSVFNQYSYYRDFFCSGTASHLRDCHIHSWVRYIDTTKITVWCMPSLILSIGLQWLFYFIVFYFKPTDGEMVKWWDCLLTITGSLCYLLFFNAWNITSQNTGTHSTFIILSHRAGSSEPQVVLKFWPIVNIFCTMTSWFRVNSKTYPKVSAIYWKY